MAAKRRRANIKDFEILDSIERVKAIAHAERLAMIEALTRSPLTGAMVARELGMPVGRAHYHLQRLLERGLIRETGRGRKRWKEERYYSPTARNFLVHPSLACSDGTTVAALERSVESAFLDWRRREILGVDLAAVASHVVHRSLRIEPGANVLVLFGPPALELGEAILVELEAAGARGIAKHWSRNIVLRTLDRYASDALARLDFVRVDVDRELDAVLFLSSNVPEGAPPNAEQRAKLPLLLDAVSRWHRSVRARRIPYLEVALPHRGELEGGGVSPEEAIDVFWRSLIGDPRVILERGSAILARMAGRSRVTIEGPGTDLELELDLERAHLGDGAISDADVAAGHSFDSLPAGSLSFIPIPAGANGVLTADYTFAGGRHAHSVRAVLRAGRIVELGARRGVAHLRRSLAEATGDAGLIAEVGIGLNPAGRGTTGKPVLDACFAGTLTVSFGNNELLGGDVRSTLQLIMPSTAHTLRAGAVEIVTRGELRSDL